MTMFKSFRWQIGLWFLGLSTMVYLVLSVLGAGYFYTKLSYSMDEELKVVASQIGHAIHISDGRPTFRDWLRVVETEPARSIMSMQLFDAEGNLLEHYGPVGIPKLSIGFSELSSNGQTMRIRHSPLNHHGKLVGYLQLQLPATKRMELTKEFLLTMTALAPFVLGGFGLCGYIVSGIASKPIEKLVATLQRFVADAGHELNTPSSIVQARAQSLERKLAKQEVYQEDVIVIATAAERMGYIVRNLMFLTELDNTHRERAFNPVDVSDLVKSAALEYADRFEKKNISFTCNVGASGKVVAEKESLNCVLTNLLENALKYTENGGQVGLSSKVNGSHVMISVEDNGIGIPAECLPHIFERFYRVDKSRSRNSGGSGLGLSIVKAIVESLKGRIDVTSQENIGTRVDISLPLYKGIETVAQNLHTNSQQLN